MFANKSGLKMKTVCPQCGSSYSESVQFCDKCGFNIQKDSIIQEQKKSQTTASPNMNKTIPNNKLQGYIQIIAVIEVAFGLFGLFASIILGIVSPFIPEMIKSTPTSSDTVTYTNQMLQFFTIIGIVLAVMMLVISVLVIYIGYKLYRLENTGRFGSMIVAAFALLAVPFGTAFGIISLVLLSKPETIELLREKDKYL